MNPSLCRRTVALLLGCVLATACTRQPQVVIHTPRGSVTVTVEVAASADARARGLMYRRDLAADAGMLFVFPDEARHQFWMKNTPLALDLVFVAANRRIVGIVADARPFSTHPLRVSEPSQHVLEVHAGFCAAHGITAGDTVEFVGIAAVPD